MTGTGPLGCVPGMLAMRGSTGDCDAELQQAAGMFNPQLVDLIKDLNSELGSDVFIAANAFNLHMTFISEPEKYGNQIYRSSFRSIKSSRRISRSDLSLSLQGLRRLS